jgi:glucose-6-phosphate isomerase
MESNGKSIGRDGHPVNYQTELLFGRARDRTTRFFQLIPRNKIDSADFIGFVKPLHGDNEQHDKLMSNLPKQKPYFTENQQKVQIEFDLQGLPN